MQARQPDTEFSQFRQTRSEREDHLSVLSPGTTIDGETAMPEYLEITLDVATALSIIGAAATFFL